MPPSLLRLLCALPLYLESAGEGGSGGGAPATEREVELGPLKLKLPADQAEKAIAWRDEQKKSSRELAERLGTLEAQAKAAEDAKRKADEEAERAKLTSKGQFDEALRLEQEKHRKALGTLATKYRDRALESLVRGIPEVLPEAVEDVVARLSHSCVYNLDADTITPMDAAGKPRLGSDGKPLTAEAVVREFLDSKPHFRRASGSPGSGASGGGKGSPGGPVTMTSAEYDAAMKDPGRAQKVASDIAAKRVVITD